MDQGIGLGMRVAESFFDREAIARGIERAERKGLSKAGAFIRTRARSSIRRRKKPSEPGQPPSAHSTDSVRTVKNILFSYEPSTQSVVVGPVKLNGLNYLGAFLVAGTVPQVLEQGGTVGIREKQIGDRWISVGAASRAPGQPTRIRRAAYRKRPFMGPALTVEAPNVPRYFADSMN